MVDTPFWVEIDTPTAIGLHINPAERKKAKKGALLSQSE